MSLSARDKHIGPLGEAWQRYLVDDQEKLAGQIHWNDDLIKACNDKGVLDKKECEDLMVRLHNKRIVVILFLKKGCFKCFTQHSGCADVIKIKG